MMTQIRTWLLSVLTAALFLGALESILPKGAVRRVGRLAVGLVLTLILCRPLVSWLPEALHTQWEQVQTASTIADERLAECSADYLLSVMSQRCEEYIQTAAEGLGVSVSAHVTCRWEGELPVPDAVEVSGSLTAEQQQALSGCIANQLGISMEQITFQEVNA